MAYFRRKCLYNSSTALIYTLLILLITSISCSADSNNNNKKTNDPGSDFISYWKDFRDSVISNDVNTIVKMTKFPFEVKGDLDMGGSKKINSEEFSNQFKAFLDQDTRENLTPESMRDFIIKQQVISSGDSNEVSAGLFDFEKTNNKWYFVRVYVEGL